MSFYESFLLYMIWETTELGLPTLHDLQIYSQSDIVRTSLKTNQL